MNGKVVGDLAGRASHLYGVGSVPSTGPPINVLPRDLLLKDQRGRLQVIPGNRPIDGVQLNIAGERPS